MYKRQPLGSLVGSQEVRAPLSLEVLHGMKLWTKETTRAVVDKALDKNDVEAKELLELFIDRSIIPALYLVQKFLGHDPDVSGGTIGEPRSPQPYVYVLKSSLKKALFRGCNSKAPFPGPAYSSRELYKRALTEFLWEWIDSRD